jgi:hypothetical protein
MDKAEQQGAEGSARLAGHISRQQAHILTLGHNTAACCDGVMTHLDDLVPVPSITATCSCCGSQTDSVAQPTKAFTLGTTFTVVYNAAAHVRQLSITRCSCLQYTLSSLLGTQQHDM